MNKKQRFGETGSAHLVVIIGLIVVAIVGFAGWKVYSSQHKSDKAGSQISDSKEVRWSFENDTWKASGTPPACPSPLLASPVDMSTATSILYPGQTRGIYKAHGGFRFDNNKDNNVDVTVAIDSKLVRIARYEQTEQIQYLLDFVSPCGIAIRYDHLLTLTKPFMDMMNKLPAPRVNDSRTTDIPNGATYPAGTLIATQIGFLAPAQGTT